MQLLETTGTQNLLYGSETYDSDQQFLTLPTGQTVSFHTERLGPTADKEVVLRFFDQNLQQVGSDVVSFVADNYRGAADSFSLHLLNDGGFLVVWQSTQEDTFRNYYNVNAQRLASDGTVVGNSFRLFEGDAHSGADYFVNAATVLDNGNIVVAAEFADQSDHSNDSQYIRIFSPDGTQLHETGPLGLDVGRVDFVLQATDDGGFMALNRGYTYNMSTQRYDATGTAIGSPIEAVTQAYTAYHSDASITRLANGNTVVSWADEGGDGSAGAIFARVFDTDGQPIGDQFLVNTTTYDWQQNPHVAALPDGRFFVAWFDQGGISYNYHVFDPTPAIRGQVYNSDGTAVGDEQVILLWPEPTVHGDDRGPSLDSIFALEDGTLVVNLLDEGGLSISAQQFTIANTLTPTSGNDFLSYMQADDIIDALSGDDIVYGHGGNDRIIGGDGNDTLLGGDGLDILIGGNDNDTLIGGTSVDDLRDVIYGGAGNDTIDGGYGNDELRGDAGDDNIAGGFGADLVIGGAGNDVLTGSAFGDEVHGGDGFDFINGGFGHDRVNGGAGADKFYHLGIADHGSDWIQDYTAVDGDVLLWGGGAATADDFLIQRAETTNAGATGVEEIFVTHIPSGNLLWALVDGDAQAEINIQIAGQVYDLLG